MTSSKPNQPAGESVLKEAMELLNGLTFDAVRGGTARTESLFISILPDWEDDGRETFRASLSCQAMWHRKVDWRLLRVSVRPAKTSGFFVQHVLPLSTSGSATFEGLEAGTYTLRAYSHLVNFTAPQPGGEVRELRDATQIPLGVAMDEDGSEKPGAEPITRRESVTDEIEVLISTKDRFISFEFATKEEEYAGRSFEFCVANPQTKELYLDAQLAVFGTTPAEGEDEFRTSPIELSFSSGDDVEVSGRIV